MIIQAYALPHPPLAVPAVGQGQENKIKDTLAALSQVSKEIAEIAPEVIIFITPHGTVYSDYFHISPGDGASGDFALFGQGDIKVHAQYDTALAEEIARIMPNAGFEAEKNPALDHGVIVPLWYINQEHSNFKIVRISHSGLGDNAHYQLGYAITKAVEITGRRAVLVASGDLSHKLAEDSHYGYAPEGTEFDKLTTTAFASGNLDSLLDLPDSLRSKAVECGHNSFLVLAGCFAKQQVQSQLLSYEHPFGVGYAVASFKPVINHQSLARKALEHAVLGKPLSLDFNQLPKEMTERRAGVFVSIHKQGQLRGCIGTIAPTTDNIAKEIAQSAVNAGLHDNRFDPVTAEELAHLSYKVDVLGNAEVITDISCLDVNRYGIIVTCGHRRGLLLPNLDGVDTVDDQIAIACQKAGIPEGSTITLERFEVVRYTNTHNKQ